MSSVEPTTKMVKKICVLGDFAVGKTSLIRRYVLDLFDDKYITTMGTKITKREMRVGVIELTMQIWDIVGNIIYRKLQEQYYKGSDAAFVVCDLTRPESEENLNGWTEHYLKVVPRARLVFLGNKADVAGVDGPVEKALAMRAARHKTTYLRTSARNGLNVEKAFEVLSHHVLAPPGTDFTAGVRKP